jgi:hypothetical protein
MIMVLCILISRFLDRQENKRVNSMVASIPRILSDPSVFVNAFWICYCHALSWQNMSIYFFFLFIILD